LLQDTIPAKGNLVVPGIDLPFYVSEYIEKVVITVSYPRGAEKGTVQVLDPSGQAVEEGEAGVARFSGAQNPVEVISISAPRLADTYKDQNWSIRTEWAVNVFIDRLGSYRIEVLAPEVVPLGLKNLYLVSESHSPRQPVVVRFTLQDSEGEPILEPQPAWAEILLPDGTLAPVPHSAEIRPDEDGAYEMLFDLPAIYPYVGDKFARFAFVIHAGSAGEHITDAIPIATARLLVDVGPNPFIQLLNPAKVECSPGAGPKIQVTIGDIQTVISGTLSATLSGPAGDMALTGQDGELRGDLTELCTGLLSQVACGEESEQNYTLLIEARLQEERPFQSIERSIPVHVMAVRCTPSPTQTAMAFIIPTPRPTAQPDGDSDGLADSVDKCPSQPGSNYLNGCPASTGVLIAGGLSALGLAVIVLAYVWPRLSVCYISPPPDVFLAVCTRENSGAEVFSLREVGIKRHTTRVKIGGDKKKADIYIPGLKPIEFKIEVRGDKIILADASKGEARGTFRQLSAEMVITSNPGIRLWTASKRSALDNVTF
jgi:hypothetical protein